MRKVIEPILLIAIAVALSSCGNIAGVSPSKNVADNKSISIQKHDEGVTAVKETLTVGDAAKYPREMPFEQYPSSKVTLSSVRPEESSVLVNLETADAPEKVVSYYKNWFDKNKWKIVQETSTSGLATICGEGDKKQASIMSMPGAGASEQTSIQITLSIGK